MKKRNAVYCVTAGHPKKIVRSVILTVLANFGNLIPVGFLTLAVLSLYSYFGGASEVLDLHQLWMVWGAVGIAAVVLYFLELAANHAPITADTPPEPRGAWTWRNTSASCPLVIS